MLACHKASGKSLRKLRPLALLATNLSCALTALSSGVSTLRLPPFCLGAAPRFDGFSVPVEPETENESNMSRSAEFDGEDRTDWA